MGSFMKTVIPALILFILLSSLTGVLYPLAVTGVAQLVFPGKAKGSLLIVGKSIIGSELLAQKFTQAKYFWPRPSAVDYQTIPSGASNLGLTSRVLRDQIETRKKDGFNEDMLFTSGSGLDPHITPASAYAQTSRIAIARKVKEIEIVLLIQRHTEGRQFYTLGQPRVNVLKLNVDLDKGLGIGQ